MSLSVRERLAALGDLIESRAIYGDSYKTIGQVMAALFPSGVSLCTGEEMNRLVTFIQLVWKVRRYAAAFDAGGHEDSLDDLAIYAQLMKEIDRGKASVSVGAAPSVSVGEGGSC